MSEQENPSGAPGTRMLSRGLLPASIYEAKFRLWQMPYWHTAVRPCPLSGHVANPNSAGR